MIDLAVGYEEAVLYDQAKQLANTLNLPLNNQAKNSLFLSNQGLVLKISPFLPLAANFSYDHWKKRKFEGKGQAIIKACQPKPGLKILDTTAGWGRDAAILAVFGAKVQMLERQPIMHALLEDALKRQDSLSKHYLDLSLIKSDALSFLSHLKEGDYDVIYIDPMHPSRQKNALVKKELQALQQLIGPDEDAKTLIELATKSPIARVVVKWPDALSPLITPNFSIRGKTIRYDIYC